MQQVKSLALCLFLASGLSEAGQTLHIKGSERLTENQKALALTASYAVLKYLESNRNQIEIGHSLGIENLKGIKIVPNVREYDMGIKSMVKMGSAYGMSAFAKKEVIDEGLGIKWGRNFSGFANTRGTTDISAVENGELLRLVIREMDNDGQMGISRKQLYEAYKETGFFTDGEFDQRVEIRYSSPLSEERIFNAFGSNYGLDTKEMEWVKREAYAESAGYYGFEQQGKISALLQGETESIEPKAIYVQFSSEPLGGGGGAPRKDDFIISAFSSQEALFGMDYNIGIEQKRKMTASLGGGIEMPETIYVHFSSEPLGGGGGAPPRKDDFTISAFSSQEISWGMVGYSNPVEVKISISYSLDELEDGSLDFYDGSTVLFVSPFQNY